MLVVLWPALVPLAGLCKGPGPHCTRLFVPANLWSDLSLSRCVPRGTLTAASCPPLRTAQLSPSSSHRAPALIPHAQAQARSIANTRTIRISLGNTDD